jgi:hypothetical protein
VRYIQAISAALAVCMLAALVACSSGSSSTPPPPPAISVTVSGAPATLTVNGTADLTATVANDSANGGVTWSCAPSGSCGTFSAATTASGAPTTYTAPSSVPSSAVTVTAASVTDPTKTGTASITITTPAITLADGFYVFSLAGSDLGTVASAYNTAGAFQVTGGVIVAGEQDFVDDNSGGALHDAINPTGSSIITTADGNLQITLTTCLVQDCTQVDTGVGGGTGVEVINGSMVSATRARLVEFDDFATSSGTLDLQDDTAAVTDLAGPYAFGVQGIGLAIGGIANISGATVSTTGTVLDLNLGGTVYTNQTISVGSALSPDTFGRVQVSMTPSDSTNLPILNFVGYIVDASRIQLVAATAPVGGIAYSQNVSNLTVSGSYVASLNGFDGFGPIQAAGILTFGSSGALTGTLSYNDLVSLQSNGAVAVTGTYVADTTNLGRVTLTSVTDGTNTFNMQGYIDGNGNFITLTADTTEVMEGYGSTQDTSGTFSGTYVLAATGADGSINATELDAVGPITSDGTSAFSGFVDLNYLGASAPTPNVAVSGTFSTPAGGVSTGSTNTLTGLDVLTTTNADVFDYYIVDTTRVIGVEIDSNQNTLAYFDLVQ